MTLEEALELIPTHIVLREKKDRWQEGDEGCVNGSDDIFFPIHPQYHSQFVEGARFPRRPIPEAVRKQMAQNISNWSLNSNFNEVNSFEGWLLSTQGESK